MDKRELNRERRRQRALERLGTNNPRCVILRLRRPFGAGAASHRGPTPSMDKLAPVCRNCHRLLSDWQKDHPTSATIRRTIRADRALPSQGLADMFELLVKWLRESRKQAVRC